MSIKFFAFRKTRPFSAMVLDYNALQKEGEFMFNPKEKEMQKAIDMAWEHPTEAQKLYFPNGKPTVKEFIQTISDIIKTKNTDDIFGLGAKNANPTDSKLSSAEDIVLQ